MLPLEDWMDIQALYREGLSVREIARQTGRSRNTIARLLAQPAPQPFTRSAPESSKLDPFKDYLVERYREVPLSAVRLHLEIQAMGYSGSVDLIRRFLRSLKQVHASQTKATVRFETPPGHQGQMDWAMCGKYIFPGERPVDVYAFVMVLCFSRMLYLEFVTSMAVPSLVAGHLRAFDYFGGWPRELLYDNMKQVRRCPGSDGEWNPLFLDFAYHYGLTPRVCRVRRPRTKGKVERSIRYVKDNFLAGRHYTSLADMNAQALHWLNTTANARLHATTQRRPCDLLHEEKLTPLTAIPPYPIRNRTLRRVDAESFIHYEGSRYSVAPEHVGATLVVEEGEQHLRVRKRDLIIAEHQRAAKPGSCVVQKEHLEALWRLTVLNESSVPQAYSARQLPTLMDGVAARPLSTYAEAA